MDLVVIAKIRKPHGVKGEVAATPMTFDLKRFAKLKEVTLRKDIDIQTLEFESYRQAGKDILLKFAGIDDRNAAEALRHYEVCIPAEDRLPLPDNEAYFDQVIGMKAIDADSGAEIGIVSEVYAYPAGTAYEIRMPDGQLRIVTTTGGEVVSLSRSEGRIRLRLLEEA